MLGILAPELEKSIGRNEAQYGCIVTAFQTAYAISLLAAGGLMDRLGTRKGYSIAVIIWSTASMAHALARSASRWEWGTAEIFQRRLRPSPNFGWRWAFLLTGVTDFIWLACWLATYRRPEDQPKLSKAEFEYIRSDPQETKEKIPWARLFDQARLDGESRAQDGHADLRLLRHAGLFCLGDIEPMGRHRADRVGYGSAPGMVGQLVRVGRRHVPA